MSDAWMPGAGHLRAAADGGHLRGGAPRAVWQSLGADPDITSALSAAQRLSDLGRACHLSWNPLTGEIIQLVSILRAGRALGGPEGLEQLSSGSAADSGATAACGPGGEPPAGAAEPGAGRLAEVNSEGRFCVQIGVVAQPWKPFTAGPMTGLRGILDWLDSWGVPRRWPAGQPAAYPHGHASYRNRRLWANGGHFGASQVPGWTAAGPGEIDIERLTGRGSAPVIGIQAPGARAGADRSERARNGQERGDQQRGRQDREQDERKHADVTGLAALDDVFESPAPAAGSLSRVG